jgi:hypothetical protein
MDRNRSHDGELLFSSGIVLIFEKFLFDKLPEKNSGTQISILAMSGRMAGLEFFCFSTLCNTHQWLFIDVFGF